MTTSKKPVSPRTLARFQRAAAQYGGKVLRAEWEPLGIHMVFDGQDGGWKVKLRFGDESNYTIMAVGRNVEDAIEDIKHLGNETLRYAQREKEAT